MIGRIAVLSLAAVLLLVIGFVSGAMWHEATDNQIEYTLRMFPMTLDTRPPVADRCDAVTFQLDAAQVQRVGGFSLNDFNAWMEHCRERNLARVVNFDGREIYRLSWEQFVDGYAGRDPPRPGS